MATEPGCLYVVGTPIGNLEDVTLRALRVLKEVDLIAAEDTRVTRKLLAHYDIHTPLISLHEHNERARSAELIQRLQQGQAVALVSDAGMPTISDPGGRLVAEAVAAGCPLQVVPGPSAVLAAVAVSGLEVERFAFEGFLPRQGQARQARLEELARLPHALVLFEAPGRLVRTLQELRDVLGPRRVAVARELTKRFEEVIRGDWETVLDHFHRHPPRGELVIVVAGADPQDRRSWTDQEVAEALGRLIAQQVDRKEAIREVARLSGRPRREVYQIALRQRSPSEEAGS
ncbi:MULTISPECIES: 16S rRNA (cytidine(1402)-2'-O)-methyltransferase [Limnochorda]|uniref:16S rRNA (cytidine(1402)-2'-O)-methyltransferase n=1 Tax=Limnochorda TaxID=1676651 RepID=UPI0017A9644A|nr:16S rRNA (cytidine(1402)-2'-O)-methyltransferase [Limnochorda pilosa]MBO2485871.1 16S rRNA (cytidine(1402)-2'-O)-methyltransferase [Bacillota bacterium]MBO2519190.1 16S rRNA (cytidine(1402)-2'-O)-methyltransferase [Bacillota bacterium]NMA72215.1 16S rRNA (cytidine(1402)-2'-O)-methyltransferase [Bacillota bacterium]